MKLFSVPWWTWIWIIVGAAAVVAGPDLFMSTGWSLGQAMPSRSGELTGAIVTFATGAVLFLSRLGRADEAELSIYWLVTSLMLVLSAIDLSYILDYSRFGLLSDSTGGLIGSLVALMTGIAILRWRWPSLRPGPYMVYWLGLVILSLLAGRHLITALLGRDGSDPGMWLGGIVAVVTGGFLLFTKLKQHSPAQTP